jgi:hypothetical protein
VAGFQGLIHHFERSISILGRSPSTFQNYSQHIATIPQTRRMDTSARRSGHGKLIYCQCRTFIRTADAVVFTLPDALNERAMIPFFGLFGRH